ncbi:MAG: hypothetical protein WCQ26_13925, partial [Pseudanabaena sp. ELA748]
MPFRFNLPSRTVIENSFNGNRMLRIIEGNIPGNPGRHILITGCPGSGKTTVSIHHFIHCNNLGVRVQFVTFQRMLRYALTHMLGTQGIQNPQVATLCKWYYDTTREFLYCNGNDDLPTADEVRQRLAARLPARFDKFLVDEGQDVHPKVYHALPHLADHVMVGADDAQQMYERGARSGQIRQILEANGGVWHCELQYNYRNTFETYDFARQFVADMPAANEQATVDLLRQHRSAGPDARPRVFVYTQDAQMVDRLTRIFRELHGSNIAVLAQRLTEVAAIVALMNTIRIDGQPLQFSVYHSNLRVPDPLQQILVTTFKSAKGMEFDAVILPFLPASTNLDTRRQCFVACTRAVGSLHVFCHSSLHPLLANFRPDTYQLRSLNQPAPQAHA